MRTSLLCCVVAIVATAASSSAASPTILVRGPASATAPVQEQVLSTPVVPLRVQRLLKKRAPLAAYVPTRFAAGYTYLKHENLYRGGFDLYSAAARTICR